jgi:hypothetical protein
VYMKAFKAEVFYERTDEGLIFPPLYHDEMWFAKSPILAVLICSPNAHN